VAEQLGQAELLLTVNTSQLEQGLRAARQLIEGRLSGVGDNAFDGIERSARASGERAGKALTDGVKKATDKLKFGSLDEALSFNPQNTIRGLTEYTRALQELRDTTSLGSSSTQQLNDRIGAVDSALKRAKQTTAEATAEQQRLNAALDKAAYTRLIQDARAFSANLREQSSAAAAASRQFQEFRKNAEGVAKTLAGISAKGLSEAVKLPIFGLPKEATSGFEKARAQIERLQKQAETASGKVARLTEGVAVLGAGGFAAKGIVDTLGGIGTSAEAVTRILNEARDALASLPGPLKGLGGLDDVFSNGAQAIQQWASGILQAQGDLVTLAGPLQAVTDALGALGPEAAAVGGALAFTFAGFQDLIAKSFKPGIDGAREALKGMTADTQLLLEALSRVSQASSGIVALRDLEGARADATQRVQANPVGSEENIAATRELLDINKRIREEKQRQFYQEQQLLLSEQERLSIAQRLRDAARPSSQLALPSSEMLDARGRGIQRLDGRSDFAGIDQGLQSARNFTQELLRAGQASNVLPGIFAVVNSSLKTLVDTTREQTLGSQVQRELLEDQLTLQNQIRAVEAQRSKDARARNEAAVQNSPERQRARQEQDLLAVQNKRRAAETKDRNRRRSEAVSNAVIGGAFPLLFGQGIGASLGGGAGGALGGLKGGQFGFGLSLVGTAVGTAFDTALANVTALGQALSSPVASFSKLSEAALISTKALESQIGALIDTGREAEAAALIQKDLAQKFGSLDSAQQLATQTDVLNRTWANLTTRLAQFVSGPAAAFLALLNRALGGAPGGADKNGQPTGISFGSFKTQVDQISKERGRGVAADLVRRQITERDRILKDSIRTGKNITLGAADEKAAKRVLDQAAAEGIITKEQQKQLQALDAAKTLRTDLLRLGLQLTAADAQGNKTLVDAIKLTSSYKKERLDLLALTPEQRQGPRGDAIRERAQAERQAIREQAKAAAESSARDLKNAKELVGLYGTQRQIREEELKIAEAKRIADQAEDAKSRNKFTDPANRKVLEDRALAAANAYNKARIEGEQRIGELQRQNFAQQITSLNRLADLQDQINVQNTRATGRLGPAGIGALEAFNQFKAARRLEQNAQAELRVRPGDVGLQNAAREAAKQTELAAAKARADLIEAAEAAEKSVKSISESLQDAVLAQQSLVGGDQGLNAFLPGQAATNRQAQVNAELQAATRAAKQEFINSLGPNADPAVANAVNRREFSGTLAEQNAQMVQFIESIRQEIRGAQGIDDLNQQLVKAQNDLVTINSKLYEINVELRNSMSSLAEKNWTVNVNVPGGSASGDVVGAVNSRS